jgi:hypothetical protein
MTNIADLKIMHSYYYDILINQDGAADAIWTDDHVKVCTPRLTLLRFSVARLTARPPPAVEDNAQPKEAECVC